MHPRSPYRAARPDFAALARVDSALAALVRVKPDGSAQLDWSDPRALRELSRVLLLHDFGVHWTLPPHALCPTVPSRLNYLLWIEDLVALGSRSVGSSNEVMGLDIGTGASCIYPLLGVAHLGWRFLATEIDPVSVRAARQNVQLNAWEARIEVRQVHEPPQDSVDAAPTKQRDPSGPLSRAETSAESDLNGDGTAATSGIAMASATATTAEEAEATFEAAVVAPCELGSSAPLLDGVLLPEEHFAFCMCNPPWFSEDETPRPNTSRGADASRCAATLGELYTAGGEVGFIARLLTDSLVLRNRIRWYTCLVGRKKSLGASLRAVRAAGALHVRTTELRQGVTSRWALAWSFDAAAATRATPPEKPACKTFDAPEGLSRQDVHDRALASVREYAGVTLHLERQRDEREVGGSDAEDDVAKDDVAEDDVAVGETADRERAGGSTDEAVLLRGRVVESDDGTAHAAGSKRSRDDVAEQGTGVTRPPAEFTFEVALEAAHVSVVLVTTTQGEASSAFWRLAERVRNDVVRDTRKWRRRALDARAASP